MVEVSNKPTTTHTKDPQERERKSARRVYTDKNLDHALLRRRMCGGQGINTHSFSFRQCRQ